MIEIKVVGWEDGMELEACGHAAYAPRGADVVCAGVSALLFGYLAYLRSVTGEDGEMRGRVECAEGDGYLRISTRRMKGSDHAAWAVVSAGVRLIADAYPAHVRLTEKTRSGGLTEAYEPESQSKERKEREGHGGKRNGLHGDRRDAWGGGCSRRCRVCRRGRGGFR